VVGSSAAVQDIIAREALQCIGTGTAEQAVGARGAGTRAGDANRERCASAAAMAVGDRIGEVIGDVRPTASGWAWSAA
jgi:hypothetical protein